MIEDVAAGEVPPKKSALPNPDTPLKGLRILLIDDCEDNQFLFKRMLTRKGAVVTLAGDGLEGLHLAGTQSFDSVLLDIQMPVMDGFQAMAQLQARGFSTPVLALTGFSRAAEKRDILQAGFASIVSKPVDGPVLIDSILACLKGKSVQGASPQ